MTQRWLNPSEPDGDVLSMGPDQPTLWAQPALVALVLGLLTLARALRWRVRV